MKSHEICKNVQCGGNAVFSEPQTKAVIDFAWKTLKTAPEFLWAKFPMNAVLRRPDNRKWYALLVRLDRKKLHLSGDGTAEAMVLKLNPPLIDILLSRPGFLPAYHMNKTNWITVLLDGSVITADIFELLRYSYTASSADSLWRLPAHPVRISDQ